MAPPRPVSVRGLTALLTTLGALLAAAPAQAGTGFVPAADLESITGQLPFGPSAASAADGTAFVAWVTPGSPGRALVATRPPGGAWGTQDLGPARKVAGGIPIAAAADGRAALLVVDPDGTTLRAWSRSPGGAFGAPRPLAGGTGLELAGPAVAMNGAGEVVAVWRESADGGSTWQARGVVRDAGGWQGSVGLAPASSHNPVLVANERLVVAINAAGRAAAAFTTYDGSLLHAWLSIRPEGGSFGPAAPVRDEAGVASYGPAVDVSPSGVTLIGFQEHPGDFKPVVRWRYTAPRGASLGLPETLSAPGENATQAAVAAGPGDALHAAWVQIQSATTFRVTYGAGSVTQGFTGSRVFVSPPGEQSNTPALTVDPQGNRFVAWANSTSTTLQGAYRRGDSADFAATQTVPASGSRTPSDLSAALDAQGNVLVAWARNRPDGTWFVQATGYDVGPPSLAVSLPGVTTVGAAAPFSAAASDVWSAPAVRWSFGDGAAADGPAVTHAYGGRGAFTASAIATDGFGNTAAVAGTVSVLGPEDVDADGDGVTAARDCNDRDAGIRPGAVDPPGDGIDQDCSGADSPYASLEAGVTLTWGRIRRGGATPIVSMRVEGVRTGDRLTLRCTGQGCPKKLGRRTTTLKAKAVRRGRATVAGVGGLRLRPKAKLALTVARTGFVSRTFTYEMRSGKTPRKTTRCQAPGAKRSTPCG